MTMMVGLLKLLALGFLVALALGVGFVVHRLLHPPRRTYASAIARGIAGDPSELDEPRQYEAWRVTCRTSRGSSIEFELWDIPGDDASGPVVIAAPGWGDGRAGVLPRLGALLPSASRVLAWESPGHGEAPGRCTLGVHEPDLLKQIAERAQQIYRTDIVLFGWSMGAGVCIVAGALLSESTWLRAVIAEAPYRQARTPAFNVIRMAGLPYRMNGPIAFWLLGMLLGVGPTWRGFDRAEWSARLRARLVVLHGSDDRISPPEDGREIARTSPDGSFIEIAGAGHNDLWTDESFRAQMVEAVVATLQYCRAPSRGSAGNGPADSAPAPGSAGTLR